MTTYYVGAGGSNANSGLTWALRKLTLNGAEDVPVVAGDTVYVAPGAYRELLTVDVSGTAGNIITYIGDVTGEQTDGVGGVVRVTGSDNDTTGTRGNCVNAAAQRNYRTFRGFSFDTTTGAPVNLVSPQNWIIEDCFFDSPAARMDQIAVAGASQLAVTIRRCVLLSCPGTGIGITHTVAVDNTGHVIENCVIGTCRDGGIRTTRVGGITVRNCLIFGVGSNAIQVVTALTVGQTLTVNNCVLWRNNGALVATTTAEFVEDYNTLWQNVTDRTNVTAGGNSVAFPPLFQPPLLLAGHRLPWRPFDLSEWSQIIRKAGTGEAALDLFGLTRPATSAKKSWGAIQFVDAERETGTVQAGSASLVLRDAGLLHVARVPVGAESTTISLYVRWEADYAGTKPRMILRQPGQADRTTTAVGAHSTWEQLTDTWTPAALPPYVDVFVESSNTAAATNYDTFCDTLAVS